MVFHRGRRLWLDVWGTYGLLLAETIACGLTVNLLNPVLDCGAVVRSVVAIAM